MAGSPLILIWLVFLIKCMPTLMCTIQKDLFQKILLTFNFFHKVEKSFTLLFFFFFQITNHWGGCAVGSSGSYRSTNAMPLFGKSPKTPRDLVHTLKDNLLNLQNGDSRRTQRVSWFTILWIRNWKCTVLTLTTLKYCCINHGDQMFFYLKSS